MTAEIPSKTLDGKSIHNLYEDAAKRAGALEFVFTLLRAEGLTQNEPDQIRHFFGFLQGVKQRLKKGPIDDAPTAFKIVTGARDTYCLLYNLIGNAIGEAYKIGPLPSAKDDRGWATGAAPPKGEHIEKVLEKAAEYKEKNPAFYQLMQDTYNDEVKKIYRGERNFDAATDAEHLQKIIDFLHDLLKKYYRVLKTIGGQQPKHFPFAATFDVVEVLANEQEEMYGVNVHHSNGSLSFFKRYADSTDQMYYSFGPDGQIVVLHSPNGGEPMWMWEKKPLYEQGYPGRYNPIGEWRPLYYPGKAEEIQRRAREAAKDEHDKRVEGCLFYAMATCRHAVEFVVKSNFEFRHDFLTTSLGIPSGDLRIHLHKIEMPEAAGKASNNTQVYDGTAYLPAIDVKTIGDALDAIGLVLNRIAFRVDGKVEWKIKYSNYGDGSGKHHISKKHFEQLGEYLLGLKSPDSGLIDTAISWYTTAKSSTNSFTKYLNYYIAVESLAVALADGEMEIGSAYDIEKKPKAAKKRQAEEYIKQIHDELYKEDPIGFVRKAYTEALGSLRAKTELALKKVFGAEHEYVQAFLDKSDGKTMYELRNDLAHGNFSHIDRDEAHSIRQKLSILEDIAYHFIMKLSVGRDKKYKRFSTFSMSLDFSDPRNCMVTNNLQMIGGRKDWKIQWEWLT